MSADTTVAARQPRLNPFAFASDTDFRFVLLMVSVVGASAFIYNWLFFAVPGNAARYIQTTLRCEPIRAAAGFDRTPSLADYADPDIIAAQVAFERCRAPVERANAAWILIGMLLLLAMAAALYWIHPAWKIRRSRLVPLNPDDVPEMTEYLAGLCREAGLARQPFFLWNSLSPASSGLAFGRLGRYYVALGGGLVMQFGTDRAAFRAVILHELAHLRNADVDKTYFAIATWQAFGLAALLPLVLILARQSMPVILNVAWRVLVLSALAYFARNAVLRAREIYADLRASLWEGPAGALGRVLAMLPRPKSGWRPWLQVHPDPRKRRAALEDTLPLFRMGFWLAFATGMATTIALPSITTLLTSLLTGTGLVPFAALGAALIFVPLAVGVTGLGVWRGTFAARARGETPRGAARLGLGLGLGVIFGNALSLESSIPLVAPVEGLLGLLGSVIFNLLWGAVLLAGLVFFMRWIAAGATVWLAVARTDRSMRLACAATLAVASLLLVVWLGWLFQVHALGASGFYLTLAEPLGAAWLILEHPLTLLALVSLWAFPLMACFWPAQAVSDSIGNWAYIDPPPRPAARSPRTSLHPGLALTFGLAGAVAYCSLLLALRLALLLALPEAVRSADEYAIGLFVGQVALAALVQVGVAAVVAACLRRLGWLHGLFAAFVAGCGMAAGSLALNLLFGGSINPRFAWSTFSQFVNSGALLSLPVAWAVSTVMRWIRRR